MCLNRQTCQGVYAQGKTVRAKWRKRFDSTEISNFQKHMIGQIGHGGVKGLQARS